MQIIALAIIGVAVVIALCAIIYGFFTTMQAVKKKQEEYQELVDLDKEIDNLIVQVCMAERINPISKETKIALRNYEKKEHWKDYGTTYALIRTESRFFLEQLYAMLKQVLPAEPLSVPIPAVPAVPAVPEAKKPDEKPEDKVIISSQGATKIVYTSPLGFYSIPILPTIPENQAIEFKLLSPTAPTSESDIPILTSPRNS